MSASRRTGSAAVPAQAAGSGVSPPISDSHSARLNRPTSPRPAFTVWIWRPPFARTLGYSIVHAEFAEWLRTQDDAADRALGSRVDRNVVVKPEED